MNRASNINMCRGITASVLLSFALLLPAQDESQYDDPDNWQFTSDNYWVCAKLVGGSAKTLYADGTPVAVSSAYDVSDQMKSDQCGYGWIRLDHREILKVRDSTGTVVQQLAWHKGGQDYDSPQPPYGWVDINDISLFDGTLAVPTAQNVPRREEPQPETKGMAPTGMPLVRNQPLSDGVPYWNSGEDMWDTAHMLGKGCDAEENIRYNYKMVPTSDPDGIPRDWQYKQFKTSSRYNKYADGGADYGDGTAEYGWLMWNFLTKADGETKLGGGGQMRGLIKNGQEFYRCKVTSIKAKAWEYNGNAQAGEITAWYVKTRGNPYSPWMYGWMIAEHRVKNPDGSFGPPILHYQAESATSDGARSEGNNAVRVFPNPLNGSNAFFIDLEQERTNGCIVEIYNLDGMRVYQKRFSDNRNSLTVDNVDLKDALYVVRIISGQIAMHSKLVTNNM